MVTDSIRRWIEHGNHKASANNLQFSGEINVSRAFAALRTNIKNFVTPTSLLNSSAPSRQVSPAIPAREDPPMPEDAPNVAHLRNNSLQVSNTSQNVEYRPLFVGSTLTQLLNPPLGFIRSLLFRSYIYVLGQVLDFLRGLNLYEPPWSAHCVRLRWIWGSLTRPQMTTLN